MPEEHAERARAAAKRGDEAAAARVVADYIAGMTDRFALQTRDALRARLRAGFVSRASAAIASRLGTTRQGWARASVRLCTCLPHPNPRSRRATG